MITRYSLALLSTLAVACAAPVTSAPTPTLTATLAPTSTPVPTTAAPTTPRPSATHGAYLGAFGTYGYAVDLPAGWRRSELRSRSTQNPQGDPEIQGNDLFTNRTPSDEADAMSRTHVGPGPASDHTAYVALLRPRAGETPRQFAERTKNSFGMSGTVEDITFDGRPAARTTFRYTDSDPKTFYALYIAEREGLLWHVGFFLTYPGNPPPPGATDEAVRSIVTSFRFRTP